MGTTPCRGPSVAYETRARRTGRDPAAGQELPGHLPEPVRVALVERVGRHAREVGSASVDDLGLADVLEVEPTDPREER
jgi:hypothetical protein